MKVAVTRTASSLTGDWLAIPITRRFALPAGVERFGEAQERAEPGTWVAVTSPHTFKVLRAAGRSIDDKMKLACVGAATAKKAPRTPDLIGPQPSSGANLVAAFPAGEGHVLLPCSQAASATVEDGLAERGYTVERIAVYGVEDDPAGVTRLAAARPDVIVVTAGSAGRALARLWPRELPPLIALGEPTAKALIEAGIPAAEVAPTPDRAGIETALERI